MFSRKSCVIGNFGYKNKQLDGQTIKTRSIYTALESTSECKYIDIGDGVIKSIIILIMIPFFYKEIFYLPGRRILKFFSPLLILYKYVFRMKVHYVVVGGWVTNLADNSWYFRSLLQNFNSVSCELKSMVTKLINLNVNAFYLPNFRNSNSNIKVTNNNDLKLFYFSRIISEKGVFKAIDVLHKIEKLAPEIKCSLDIYGPNLLSDYELDKFQKLCCDNVIYRGELTPTSITSTINKFDFLLFPTTYPGEGFPGCIVDAKIAGTSVVCTNWKYNSEIIDDGVDGFVIDVEDFSCKSSFKIVEAFKSGDINRLKINSHKSSESFIVDKVFSNWLYSIHYQK